MQPFTIVSGIVAPLLRDDINTDQIAPVLPLRVLDPDYAAQLFTRWRNHPGGRQNAEFVLNRPQFRAAQILVAGRNFGCGSSRESAAWAIAAFGIRCIVARSFAELFRNNCIRNGILPVVLADDVAAAFEAKVVAADGAAPFAVDLIQQRIVCPDGDAIEFQIDAADRAVLLEGLDEIGLTLQNAEDIAAWERHCRERQPWLQTMTRNPDRPARRIDPATED